MSGPPVPLQQISRATVNSVLAFLLIAQSPSKGDSPIPALHGEGEVKVCFLHFFRKIHENCSLKTQPIASWSRAFSFGLSSNHH